MPYYEILHKWHDEHNAGYRVLYYAILKWDVLVQDLTVAEILYKEQHFC